MILRYPFLRRNVTEHATLLLIVSAHVLLDAATPSPVTAPATFPAACKDPPLPGLPGGAGGGALDPVDCLGAGVGEFVGMIAEAFADGIPPNVAGDVLYLIGGPKNVIVVTRFPESVALGLAKLEGCGLFEGAEEFEQVAATVCTLDKNMKVVRH